jgi:hypothetical protein
MDGSFRPEAAAQMFASVQGRNALDLITLDRRAIGVIEIVLRESKKESGTLALAERGLQVVVARRGKSDPDIPFNELHGTYDHKSRNWRAAPTVRTVVLFTVDVARQIL